MDAGPHGCTSRIRVRPGQRPGNKPQAAVGALHPCRVKPHGPVGEGARAHVRPVRASLAPTGTRDAGCCAVGAKQGIRGGSWAGCASTSGPGGVETRSAWNGGPIGGASETEEPRSAGASAGGSANPRGRPEPSRGAGRARRCGVAEGVGASGTHGLPEGGMSGRRGGAQHHGVGCRALQNHT
jgi:hypothetical protein